MSSNTGRVRYRITASPLSQSTSYRDEPQTSFIANYTISRDNTGENEILENQNSLKAVLGTDDRSAEDDDDLTYGKQYDIRRNRTRTDAIDFSDDDDDTPLHDPGGKPKNYSAQRQTPPTMAGNSHIQVRIATLAAELAELEQSAKSSGLTKANRGFGADLYRQGDKLYLGPPQWQHTDDGLQLIFSRPLWNFEAFVAQNPATHFVVYREYTSDLGMDETNYDFEIPPPTPSRETMAIVTASMGAALEEMSKTYPRFSKAFPSFDFYIHEIAAPYLCFFHMEETWEKNVLLLPLEHQELVRAMFGFLGEGHMPLYKKARKMLHQGKVSNTLMSFLVQPGDIVTDGKEIPTCYMVQSWPAVSYQGRMSSGTRDGQHVGRLTLQKAVYSGRDEEDDGLDDTNPDTHLGDDEQPEQQMHNTYGVCGTKDRQKTWLVKGWRWKMSSGSMTKTVEELTLGMLSSIADDDLVDIRTLNFYPLRHALEDTKSLVAKRADTFWKCRNQHFVEYEYRADDANGLDFATERFIVDVNTYRLLHPQSSISQPASASFLQGVTMPTDGSMSICPSTVIGYNMRQKKWMDIEVDHIREVQWNKQAFENLAIDKKTKNVVRALVSKQIATDMSTDLISGKGNGLIMLLHGGPGTGKTLTAESVAELVEKPLYRVTCGDIGTTPGDVEKYLEAVLRLGKIWGCVVLLDEADVFLEERTLTDLNRNALVSVFLRVLEYYDGILILTSNRVGTFDEAFKSRIQLGIHYEPLLSWQRKKIWRNFLDRVNQLNPDELEYGELSDNVRELAKEDMNGRQIRNVITTARQLAQFKGCKCGYEEVQDAIEVSTKFEKYLRDVKGGISDDEMARQDSIR